MEKMNQNNKHILAANQYISGVLSGDILACKYVRLACQRQLDDLDRAKTKDFPYRFDEASAERICQFIECLPHVKGKWVKTDIQLEPWQQFILTTVFGWVRKKDGIRRFREMYVEVPRKNGKSVIAAAIGLYMLTEDGEPGSEVYAGATTEKQAWEVFLPAQRMARKAQGFSEHYGVEVNASNLAVIETGSKFEPIIGDPGDGASPHCAIVDEFHEHSKPIQYDSMITGMGARTQPLMVVITTAGVDLAGPCYDKRGQVVNILEMKPGFENEEIFGVIYTLDDTDEWSDFKLWGKANPNNGISILDDYLPSRHKEAMQRASRQNVIRCKHLNQWMNASTAFFNMLAWRKCTDSKMKMDQFKGKPCYMALDLASKTDLSVLALLFSETDENGKKKYAIFVNHYLPEEAIEGADKAHYAGWAKEGWLTLTPGNVTDYEYITDDMREMKSQFEIVEIPYDPFQATYLATQMLSEGFPMVEYGATVKNFSQAMKEFEALILSGDIRHDGNPVLLWEMSNVISHTDRKDNIFPNKERPENKIDGPVAIIMALAREMVHREERSVYEDRGMLRI